MNRLPINDLAPWLITKSGFRALVCVPDEKLDLEFSDWFNLRPEMAVSEGIAEIHIHEALTHGAPPISQKLGLVTEYGTITGEVEKAREMGAEAFLFHASSPGGTTIGGSEAASFISSMPEPTATLCDGMACSAAYKLAAGTDAIIAQPSALLGNIGTVMAYVDDEKFWEGMGIEFKAITNEGADLKGTFYESRLSEAQLEFLQESVNRAGAEFRAHVEANRNVDPEVFRAGWYSGERALQLGLVDAIGGRDTALEYLTERIG